MHAHAHCDLALKSLMLMQHMAMPCLPQRRFKKFGLARGVSSKNANGMPGSGTLAARWTCLAAHGPQADTGDRDSWSLAMRLRVWSREAYWRKSTPAPQGSHSSVGESARLITVRSAARARVGPLAAHQYSQVPSRCCLGLRQSWLPVARCGLDGCAAQVHQHPPSIPHHERNYALAA